MFSEKGMDKLQAVADKHLKPHIGKVIDALTRPVSVIDSYEKAKH